MVITDSETSGAYSALEDNLFDQKEFEELAKKMILFKLDLSKQAEQSSKIRTQYARILKKYPAKKYPAIYMIRGDNEAQIVCFEGYDSDALNIGKLRDILKRY